MAEFLKDNGRFGAELCCHTATGYRCVANHPGNQKGHIDRIMFFARHVVGGDGYPYTEVGLTGLEDKEKAPTLKEMKRTLETHGFSEVTTLADHFEDDMAFAEHIASDPNSIKLRMNAGRISISRAVEVLGKWVLEASKEFVIEQETVPDVLFHSILSEMGDELMRGPGGKEYAIKKAQDLAHTLEQGYWTA